MDSCPKNLERFVDFDKCVNLIEELQTKLNQGDDDDTSRSEAERLVESFRKTIDTYQEQPELLDPYMADLINKLTCGLNDVNISSNRFHTIFKFLYQLIKVTGFKSIVKKFPHETDKLSLLIELLSNEDPQDKVHWHTRFVLTVWLSIVILTPFDLSKFESNSSDQSISEKIYTVLLKSLSLHDSCQHVTAYCLSKFFSRPDVLKNNVHVDEFMSTTLTELASVKLGIASSQDDVKLIGHLRTLSYMFKYVPRAEMKQRCQTILDVIVKLDIEKINRELVNHLIIKLLQRVGLALLPTRVATWRYKRGSRILGQLDNKNTQSDSAQLPLKPASEQLAEEALPTSNDEEVSAAECLESILSVLFVAAQSSFTKIRWSSAKGIARLASRLSRERASEVIDIVITNYFDVTSSSEFAWHGGCLTLAEMSRNGLILEEKLADITEIVGNAIIYDKIKGSFAVGSHVRESACYVFWAMARTYEDRLLEPYVLSISSKLLCTMLFDRELQCRRAASATFQELVGRQGAFNEEGISILTNVDYQNVGQRQFAYLDLALQVASFGEKYSRTFVEHLLDKKIGHWDVQIRRLASDSLSALMLHSNHDYVRSKVLPKLMKLSDQSLDLNAKHGAILALAKIIKGLVPLQFVFDQELIEFVGHLIKKCDKQLKSKQQAPNFMEAIGFVISSAEEAKFAYPDEILKQWEALALSALDSDNATLRDIGSDALITLYKTYYRDNKTCQDRLLTILNKSLTSLNENSRCGGLRALSKLSPTTGFQGGELAASGTIGGNPSDIDAVKSSAITTTGIASTGIRSDSDTPDIVLMSLTSYIARETREKANDIVFALAKAEACEAFANFVRSLDKPSLIVSSSFLRAGYDALLGKTEDYTLDKRGDIGVVVRRASIRALEELTLYLLSIGMGPSLSSLLFDSNRVTNIVARTLQQAVSYNNSAREIAATAFYKLITSDLPENTIPHRTAILASFEQSGVNDEFNWRDDSTPIFVRLLVFPEYNIDLWTGLLPSVGQVSELCARQFRSALSDYIVSLANKGQQGAKEREIVFDAFLDTLARKDRADRLLINGLSVADYLLTQGLLNEASTDFQERLVKFCWSSVTSSKSEKGSNDPKRLVSVARVLCSMLQFNGQIQRQCLKYCLSLLANSYAKVRVYTAEQLYLSIMTYQSDLEENLMKEPASRTGDLGAGEQDSAAPEEGDGEQQAVAASEQEGKIDLQELGEQQLQAKGERNYQLDLSSAMELLSQTEWAEPLEKVRTVRDQICDCLMLA